jgi:hypothetical protein
VKPADIQQKERRSRTKRGVISLIVAIVIAAGLIPACATASCCMAMPGEYAIHAEMPCCEEQQTSIASSDDARLQPPVTGSPTPPLQWELADLAKPVSDSAALRVFATLAAVRQAHSEPPPQLFLHNAQFLI